MGGHRCIICLTHPPKLPATVKQCGHSEFCLECLQEWCRTRRQPKCPLCQAEVLQIVRDDGIEEDAPIADQLAEEGGPNLDCLDHTFFAVESERLLSRARATQMQLVRTSYSCGRQGSSSTDHAADALQQVIDTLAGCKSDMLLEVPFSPEAVLHDLYSLDQVVCQIAAGRWAAATPVAAAQTQAARFNADDAAAGLHEWQEPDSDDDFGASDDDGLSSSARNRLERASSGGRRSMPGRRGSSSSIVSIASAGSGRRR